MAAPGAEDPGDPGGQPDGGGEPGAGGGDCADVCGDGPISPECMECMAGMGRTNSMSAMKTYHGLSRGSEDGFPCNEPDAQILKNSALARKMQLG